MGRRTPRQLDAMQAHKTDRSLMTDQKYTNTMTVTPEATPSATRHPCRTQLLPHRSKQIAFHVCLLGLATRNSMDAICRACPFARA